MIQASKMTVWEKYNIEVNDWDNLIANKILEISNYEYIYCDVGACFGRYTSFFKNLIGEIGKVYSFEPNPNNYQNLIKLSSNNCIIENLAISDKIGKVEIYADDFNTDNHNSNILGYDTSHTKMKSIGFVDSISLDEYFKNINVDIMKIDVEGAELKVLQGSIETIKKCKFVVIECHFDEDWEQIVEFSNIHNFDFRYLVNDQKIYYKKSNQISMRPKIGISDNGRGYQIYLSNK